MCHLVDSAKKWNARINTLVDRQYSFSRISLKSQLNNIYGFSLYIFIIVIIVSVLTALVL